jgi:hypothetical protein
MQVQNDPQPQILTPGQAIIDVIKSTVKVLAGGVPGFNDIIINRQTDMVKTPVAYLANVFSRYEGVKMVRIELPILRNPAPQIHASF